MEVGEAHGDRSKRCEVAQARHHALFRPRTLFRYRHRSRSQIRRHTAIRVLKISDHDR